MVTIKSIDDFIKFKEFTTRPICYVYYKESLLNAYYVGFTTQHAYYYLRNHHKMKKIKDVIHNGYSIQIYTKYNEDTLIKLLKPKLNILKGTGICGRNINYVDLKHLGEVISMSKINLSYKDKKREYQNSIYKKIYKNIYSNYDTLWDNLFKNKNLFVYIHSDIIKYLIEKEKIKEENQPCNIINNEVFIKIFKYKDKSSILMNNLCSILKFCKITMLYASYIIIHKVYLKNLNMVLEENNINKETLESNRNEWYNLFHSMNNYIKIHNEIIQNLKSNNCFIDIHEKNIKKIIIYSSYLYRIAIKENFIEIYNLTNQDDVILDVDIESNS
jgi:hypothetical protein